MEATITMEPTTSSQTERDLNNLIDKFDIGCDDEELFRDTIIVFFNLDTTETNTARNEICQIAAWYNGNTFTEYILPKTNILTTELNGLEIRRVNFERKLFHYDIEVNASTPEEGLKNFLDFLGNLSGQTRKVFLAAHNCFSVFRHIIIRQMKQYNLYDMFQSLVLGFIDTLYVFKSELKKRGHENNTYALEPLASKYLDQGTILEERRHAKIKVEILVQLVKHNEIGCDDAILKQHVRKLDDVDKPKATKMKPPKAANLGLLEKKLSKYMVQKLKKAEITIDVLKGAYRENADEGISNILQEEIDGNVRVTKDSKIIKQIIDEVSALPFDDKENDVDH